MDILTLGGIAFDDYSTPSSIGGGGKQAMVVHKLPGGARVIDTLGPDDRNISWQGEFFGNGALDNVLALDAMRAAGQVVTLQFAAQSRLVVIEDFVWDVRRYPVWVEYRISCVVYQNPALGAVSSTVASITDLIVADLASAVALL